MNELGEGFLLDQELEGLRKGRAEYWKRTR